MPPYSDGNFFTFTGFHSLVESGHPTTFKVLKASMAEFLALNKQSVSLIVLEYANGTINPPHIYPHSVEPLFPVKSTFQVGFVDTTSKFFTQKQQEGDLFVFLKGLVHFQYNVDPESFAIAILAFGSANLRTVSIPNTLFITGIDDTVLAKSFKTNIATIQSLKLALAPKP